MESPIKVGSSLEHYYFSSAFPEELTRDYEPSLYNTAQHRDLQSSKWHSFYVIHSKKSRISAEVHFNVENSIASSPFRSPFGSFEFSQRLPPQVLFEFIQFAERALIEIGVKQIIIKNPPQLAHQGSASLLETLLFNQRYQVVNAEIGTIIRTRGSFENNLDSFEKRKLRQGLEAGLKGKQLNIEDLQFIYRFISQCRTAKNYSLSMTYEELTIMKAKMPDRLILFGVFKEAELVAASISILVRSDLLYNFYSDHSANFDHLSPVVTLIDNMYGYCTEHSIARLDLGTSALESKPNFGLLDFKIRLGGVATSKLTFSKNIHGE